MMPDLDPDKPDPDPVLPDPAPVKSGSGYVLAGSRSGLRFKRHGHGSVQALVARAPPGWPGLPQSAQGSVRVARAPPWWPGLSHPCALA